METPQKSSHKRRFLTTAASDRNDTLLFTLEDEKKSRVNTEIALASIKKKLDFASEQEQRCKLMSQNQPIIERNYRQHMLNYLNAKFATALSQVPKHSKQYKPAKSANHQSKLKERISFAFQEFMQSARTQNMAGTISEFQVGSLLRDMHFIKSLLQHRNVVLRLCKELKTMRLECLFMFVLHFHVLHSEKHISQGTKKQIIEQMRLLFESEGIALLSCELEQYYQSLERSSKAELFQPMRANRACRQTISSVTHSLSRGKKE